MHLPLQPTPEHPPLSKDIHELGNMAQKYIGKYSNLYSEQWPDQFLDKFKTHWMSHMPQK